MAAINDLINQVADVDLRERIQREVDKINKQKKFGLVFEEHLPECTPLYDMPVKRGCNVMLRNNKEDKSVYVVLLIDREKAICIRKYDKDAEKVSFALNDIVRVAEFGEPIYPCLKPVDSVCNAPDSDLWHTLIEADNYHALQLLEYLYAGQVDCIYIDPPYNTGANDWKYNNDYVGKDDRYRHSKWLAMMERRLKLAKKLLNPNDSVMIVTIDEKEYLRLGMLLEQMFPEAQIQMISSVINSNGVARGEFFRVNEYLYVLRFGNCIASPLDLPIEWRGNIKTSTTDKVRWGSLMRSGSNSSRERSYKCFYPIFISKDKKHFCGAGNYLPLEMKLKDYIAPNDVIAVFPIHENGTEGCWQYSRDSFLDIQKKGYVRMSTQTRKGKDVTFRYISD